MRIALVLFSVLSLGAVMGSLASCTPLEATARKDPMKCERDPKCQQKDRANDCSTQCADDSACVDRCAQINQQTGSSSR